LGDLHSARICIYSVDFYEIEKHLDSGNWASIAQVLTGAAKFVEKGGADFLLICTNTMHKVVPEIKRGIKIPIIHIADAVGEKLILERIETVGLMGTKFTMEQDFYKDRLAESFGIRVITPAERDRELVNDVIFKELCLGKILEESRKEYLRIIKQLNSLGAEAVILGCTEIALLVQQEDTPVKLFDTTRIHAEKAVELALMNS